MTVGFEARSFFLSFFLSLLFLELLQCHNTGKVITLNFTTLLLGHCQLVQYRLGRLLVVEPRRGHRLFWARSRRVRLYWSLITCHERALAHYRLAAWLSNNFVVLPFKYTSPI